MHKAVNKAIQCPRRRPAAPPKQSRARPHLQKAMLPRLLGNQPLTLRPNVLAACQQSTIAGASHTATYFTQTSHQMATHGGSGRSPFLGAHSSSDLQVLDAADPSGDVPAATCPTSLTSYARANAPCTMLARLHRKCADPHAECRVRLLPIDDQGGREEQEPARKAASGGSGMPPRPQSATPFRILTCRSPSIRSVG